MTRYHKKTTPRAKPIPGMVKCANCKEYKPPSEFTKRPNGILRRHKCIECLERYPARKLGRWGDWDRPLAVEWRGPEPMGIPPNCDEYTRHRLAGKLRVLNFIQGD
jgi:hypothetical protein